MLGFVDKGLARINCAIFNSHITWRKNFVMFVLPLVRLVFFMGNYNVASSSPLRVCLVEIIPRGSCSFVGNVFNNHLIA